MSANAGDWCSEATLLFELNLAQDPQLDFALTAYRDAAVEQIARYTGLPLVDRPVVVDFLPPGQSSSPSCLGKLLYPHTVAKTEYWNVAYEKGSLPTEEWAGGKQSRLSALDPATKRGKWYLVPPADGWPEEALRIRATLTCGLAVREHAHITQAVIMLARDYFEGVSVADRTPAWERVLKDSGYWNASEAKGAAG